MILDQLKALEAAATPGPWNPEFVRLSIRHLSKNVDPDNYTLDDACRLNDKGEDWGKPGDGQLIAAARNALPALIAVAQKLDIWVRSLEEQYRDDDQRNPVPEFIRDALARLEAVK